MLSGRSRSGRGTLSSLGEALERREFSCVIMKFWRGYPRGLALGEKDAFLLGTGKIREGTHGVCARNRGLLGLASAKYVMECRHLAQTGGMCKFPVCATNASSARPFACLAIGAVGLFGKLLRELWKVGGLRKGLFSLSERPVHCSTCSMGTPWESMKHTTCAILLLSPSINFSVWTSASLDFPLS